MDRVYIFYALILIIVSIIPFLHVLNYFSTKSDSIEKAKQILSKEGYYVASLWTEYDVQGKFDCSREEAMKVLDELFSSEYVNGELSEGIISIGIANGLKRKECEDENN